MVILYNTLNRKKEKFGPLEDNEARIYTCGPTVYDYAHIGNLRCYIFADVLVRTLELAGYKVNQVINITDVGHLTGDNDEGEDKIEKGAQREDKTPEVLADFYTKAFLSDLKKLNIKIPKLMPRASAHIPEMIDFIKRIEDAGYLYQTREAVYFNTAKLKSYGDLSGQKIGLERKSRIGKTKGKKKPTDFALWVKAVGKHKNHRQQWDSPWGRGFPGWHIECSAMSEKYLGKVFDIHTGGVDHIPVHHENEIAQSIAANNKNPAHFWMHGAFLTTQGKRMGKSEGNLQTLKDLQARGYSPLVFRFLVLRNHYRSPMQFDLKSLREAQTAFQFLVTSINRLKRPVGRGVINEASNLSQKISEAKQKIIDAFFDDLNTPQAVDTLFQLTHYCNKLRIAKKLGEAEIDNVFKEIYLLADSVLAIGLNEIIESAKKIPKEIVDLADARFAAKKEKNFFKADKIRKKIEDKGFIIEDTQDGSYRIIVK